MVLVLLVLSSLIFQKSNDKINFIFSSDKITGKGIWGKPGYPQLPAIRKIIKGKIKEIRIEKEKYHFEKVKERIKPRKKPIPKSKEYKEEIFYAKVYDKDTLLPGKFYDFISSEWQSIFEIFPINYNPQKGEIKVLDYLSGEIILESRKFLKNPLSLLIIVPDKWYNIAKELALWKRKKGFVVRVKKLSEVGNTTDLIKLYIRNAYYTWENPPYYVILVGDVDSIPYFSGTGDLTPPTDLYYSTMDDTDYLPDIALGRLSVKDSAEFVNVIKKIICYERCDSPLFWLNRAYFIASSDASYHQVAEGTHLYSMAKLRTIGMVCDSLFLYYSSGTPIYDAVNSGRIIVMYSGHGSETSWADPDFYNSDVYNLSNAYRMPFVFTFACLSGDYPVSECFSEAWLRKYPGGAIAHFASTVPTYWDEDDILQRRIIDALCDSNYTIIGDLLNEGKILFYLEYGDNSYTRGYFERYNLIGDPTLQIFTRIPVNLNVQYPVSVYLTESIHIHVDTSGLPVSGVICAVSRDTVFWGVTDDTGCVVLPNPASDTGEISLCVWGYNFKTFLSRIHVILKNITYFPKSLIALKETTLTVIVEDGLIKGIYCYLYGVEMELYDSTDDSGYCFFDVLPQYGETLELLVKDKNYVLKKAKIPVKASEIFSYAEIAPNTIEVATKTRLKFVCSEDSFKVVLKGCKDTTFFVFDSVAEIEFMSLDTGKVDAFILKPDFYVHHEVLKIVPSYVKLCGYVKNVLDSSSLCSAYVEVFRDSNLIYAGFTDEKGFFESTDSILKNIYHIGVRKFWFNNYAEDVIINDTIYIYLTPSDSFRIKIFALENDTLSGEILLRAHYLEDKYKKVYEKRVSLSPFCPFYLPSGEFKVEVHKKGFVGELKDIFVNSDTVLYFNLTKPESILIIDDGGDALLISQILDTLGYPYKVVDVNVDTSEVRYSLIIYTSGINQKPLFSDSLPNFKLINCFKNKVNNGNKFLFTGVYLFKEWSESSPSFYEFLSNCTHNAIYQEIKVRISDVLNKPSYIGEYLNLSDCALLRCSDYAEPLAGEMTNCALLKSYAGVSSGIRISQISRDTLLKLFENIIGILMESYCERWDNCVFICSQNADAHVLLKGWGIRKEKILKDTISFRSLRPGKYKLHVWADGFADTICDFVINDSSFIEININLHKVDLLYELSGFVEMTGDWEFGNVPFKPYVGYGTNLSGKYSPYSFSSLLTSEIDASVYKKVFLELWHWYDIEYYFDGGNVKVVGEDTSFVIYPYYGYDVEEISGDNYFLSGQPGFTGREGVVRRDVFEINGPRRFRIKFDFGSNGKNEYDGWIILGAKVYGIRDEEVFPLKEDFAVYPSVTTHVLKLSLKLKTKEKVDFIIFDVCGRRVYEVNMGEISPGNHFFEIDLNDVSQGVYFLGAKMGEKFLTRKFIVIK